MPQAILFDLDETLTDRVQSVACYAERFRGDFAEHLGSETASAIAAAIAAADLRGHRPRDEVVWDFARRLAWRAMPDVVDIRRHWVDHFSRSIAGCVGLEEVLSALHKRGIRLGIVTNGEVPFQAAKIARLTIGRYLSAVVISDAVGVAKPDPRIYAHALAEIGVDASRAWFVGDDPVNDVLGAAAVGFRSVWLAGARPWPAEHPAPKWRIAELGELVAMVKRSDARGG